MRIWPFGRREPDEMLFIPMLGTSKAVGTESPVPVVVQRFGDATGLGELRESTRFRPGQSGNPHGRPPADPDRRNLREARRIAARIYRESFIGGRMERRALAIADEIDAGKRDGSVEVRSVLEGIRCGRGLERAQPTLGEGK